MLDRCAQWPLRGPDTPVVVLAHRGGRGNHPENSLAAFGGALAIGADGVELDVRRTADGVAVVHHDPALAGGDPVHALLASELPASVPTLADALAVCAGAVVDVEIKGMPGDPGYDPDEVLAAEVAELVAALTAAPGGPAATLVSSFWPATVAAVAAARPELPTGLLVHPALDPLACLDQAGELGCTTLLPFRAQVDAALVAAAHERGVAVVAWTVNEPADLTAAARAGVDAVVTDHVSRALEVLGGR